jgi:hypothetical protein
VIGASLFTRFSNSEKSSMSLRRLFQMFLLLAAVMSGAACTNPFSSSSAPSTTAPTTDTFNGPLAQNGSIVFTFTVTTAGSVGVTLTSISPSTTSALGLGVGPSSNGTCSVTNTTSAAVAGSTAQLVATENPGTYCVKVSDLGNLTTSSTVTVTVAHS